MQARFVLLPVWLAALSWGGCSVGPNYHAPSPAMPAAWEEALPGGVTNRPASKIQSSPA